MAGRWRGCGFAGATCQLRGCRGELNQGTATGHCSKQRSMPERPRVRTIVCGHLAPAGIRVAGQSNMRRYYPPARRPGSAIAHGHQPDPGCQPTWQALSLVLLHLARSIGTAAQQQVGAAGPSAAPTQPAAAAAAALARARRGESAAPAAAPPPPHPRLSRWLIA